MDLPEPVRPDQRDGRPSGDAERDAAQHVALAAWIAEADVAELDLAAHALEPHRVRGERIAGSTARIVLIRPIEAAPRWKRLITHPSEIIGQVSMAEIEAEGDEISHGDLARHDSPPADAEHEDHPEPGQATEQRLEEAGGPRERHVLLEVAVVQLVELPLLDVLLGVGADDADPGQILLDQRREVAEVVLDPAEATMDDSAEAEDERREQRERDHGDRVSVGLIRSISASARAVMTTVLTRYMIAGPAAIRTDWMSLVARLIRLPVRVRE